MTDHSLNDHPEPSKPEPSKPERARRDVPRGAYNPITLDDVLKPGESPIESLVGPLDTNTARSFAAVLFVLIFFFSHRILEIAPLIIVVLLGGLLYRMNKRERLIAGAPLTFAAVRLAMLLTERSSWWDTSAYSTPGIIHASDLGIPWMPLFLSVCLFYMPVKDTYTSKLVFWNSVVLLLSGLLPVDGFSVVFALVLYTLFIGFAIALACDLLPLAKLVQPASAPAPAAQPL
jgi:hypothetical protein